MEDAKRVVDAAHDYFAANGIEDGRINIGDNDLLKVHLLNAALKSDNEGMRYKLVKLSAMDHIDGCAAFMDALTVRSKYYHEIGDKLRNERR